MHGLCTVAGEGVRSRFQLHKQRFHGHPAEQMVQRSAMHRPRAGNVGHRSAHAARRRRFFGRFPDVGLWNTGRCGHSLFGARFLPLRVAETATVPSRLDMAKSKHDVRQPSASTPYSTTEHVVFGFRVKRRTPRFNDDVYFYFFITV